MPDGQHAAAQGGQAKREQSRSQPSPPRWKSTRDSSSSSPSTSFPNPPVSTLHAPPSPPFAAVLARSWWPVPPSIPIPPPIASTAIRLSCHLPSAESSSMSLAVRSRYSRRLRETPVPTMSLGERCRATALREEPSASTSTPCVHIQPGPPSSINIQRHARPAAHAQGASEIQDMLTSDPRSPFTV